MTAPTLATATDRRAALRYLATTADDVPRALRALVASLADAHLTYAQLSRRWDTLVDACAVAADFACGGIEWRDIAPHAQPSSGSTVASEVLERDITLALADLVGGAA